MTLRSRHRTGAASEPFRLAHTTGVEPRVLVQAILAQLGPLPAESNLGFIYASDALARELEALLRLLKQATGIDKWVGSVGVAISVTAHEYYDQPALAVMVGSVPPEGLRLIPSLTAGIEGWRTECGEWLDGHQPHFGIVHGDPTNASTPRLLDKLAQDTGAFFVGGITSSQSQNLQVSGGIARGGISGVLFDHTVPVLTSHTQGCTPLGPRHRMTHAVGNVVAELDGRPALDVFREDIGEVLAKDLQRVAGYIFAGLPIADSDTGDYMVRNLLGIDLGQKLLAIGEYLTPGEEIMFCRRDGNTAREDMLRMLRDLKARADGRQIRGGVYYSCLGRGRYQFGEDSEELKMISEEHGEFPLVGFFANGEIFHNRLYGYTGVLTLFL
jgi:small ligand-binding sensory domain FIST